MKRVLQFELFFVCVVLLLFLMVGVTFGALFIAGLVQAGILLLFLHVAYMESGRVGFRIIGRVVGGLFLLFIFSFIIIESFILHTAIQSHQGKDYSPDAVIILGAGLKGTELSNTLRERLDTGRVFLSESPTIPVIVSGGQGPGEAITEAEAMGAYLIENGIKEERIFYDKTSTTTNENLENAKGILEKERLHNKEVLIVSSDYHIFRARKIGEKLGLKCNGLGSESPLLITVNYMIREYFAVVNLLVR